MNKQSLRFIPAAAAIAAAMLFGAQAMAQTPSTTPPGSSMPKDAVMPAPGNTATPMAMDKDAKATARAERKHTRMAKRAAKKDGKVITDGTAGTPSAKGDGNGKS